MKKETKKKTLTNLFWYYNNKLEDYNGADEDLTIKHFGIRDEWIQCIYERAIREEEISVKELDEEIVKLNDIISYINGRLLWEIGEEYRN